jgi:hypothetical protein
MNKYDHSKGQTLIAFGGAIKSTTDDDSKVSGYLVRFTDENDPDLSGQFFTKSTDFGEHAETDIYFDHGLDGTIKKAVIGHGTIKILSDGVWIDGQLDKANKYAKLVLKLKDKIEKAGKTLGWSSGTASHLVEVDAVKNEKGAKLAEHIKKWPLGLDASITATPCEPDGTEVLSCKSYTPVSIKELLPESDTVEAWEDPEWRFDPEKKLGHAMAAKMACEHGSIVGHLLNRQAIGLNEYSGIHDRFNKGLESFHHDLGPDLANRPIGDWDAWDVAYKSGPYLKTVKDALHATLTRAYNAGADHLLTRGHVTPLEHEEMRTAFETHVKGQLDGMPDELANRDLSSAGVNYLPIKSISGDDKGHGSLKVAEEVNALLDSADNLANNAERLGERFKSIKSTRESGGNRLGPKATGHIQEVIGRLDGLKSAFTELLGIEQDPRAAARARLEQAKTFQSKL